MATMRFRMTGLPPGVMMHNPAKMSMIPDPDDEDRGRKKAIPTVEVEAEEGAYRLPNTRQLYIPTKAFVGAIANATIGVSLQPVSGGRKLAALGVLQKGAVFPLSEYCPLSDPESGQPVTEYEIDVQRVVVPATGSSVPRARPKVNRWQTTLELEYDDTEIFPVDVKFLLERAGRIIGVLEYRPKPKKSRVGGPYGRFEVELVA